MNRKQLIIIKAVTSDHHLHWQSSSSLLLTARVKRTAGIQISITLQLKNYRQKHNWRERDQQNKSDWRQIGEDYYSMTDSMICLASVYDTAVTAMFIQLNRPASSCLWILSSILHIPNSCVLLRSQNLRENFVLWDEELQLELISGPALSYRDDLQILLKKKNDAHTYFKKEMSLWYLICFILLIYFICQ